MTRAADGVPAGPGRRAPVSGTAIASVVMACVVVLPVLPGVMAMVLAAVARGRVRASNGALRGARLATFGMVLGAVQAVASLGAVLWWSAVVVEPGSQGVVARDARVHRLLPEGVHFTVPMLDEVVLVPVERVQSTRVRPTAFLAADKSGITLAVRVDWRVCDAATYYVTLRARRRLAAIRLEEVVASRLRNLVARAGSAEVLAQPDRLAALGEDLGGELKRYLDQFGICPLAIRVTPETP